VKNERRAGFRLRNGGGQRLGGGGGGPQGRWQIWAQPLPVQVQPAWHARFRPAPALRPLRPPQPSSCPERWSAQPGPLSPLAASSSGGIRRPAEALPWRTSRRRPGGWPRRLSPDLAGAPAGLRTQAPAMACGPPRFVVHQLLAEQQQPPHSA